MNIKAHLSNGDNNPVYQKEYYSQNREALLLKNIGKQQKYKSTHPDFARPKLYSKIIRSLLRQRDGNNCGICGLYIPEDEGEIDHIIPIAVGGHATDAGNVQLSHKICNRTKKIKRKD